MPRDSWFDRTVPLPPGLEIGAIRRAVEYMERELSDLVDIYWRPLIMQGVVPVALFAD